MLSPRLKQALPSILIFLTGLWLSIFILPFLLIWRALLCILYTIEKTLQLTLLPNLALYKPAQSQYQNCRAWLLKCPVMQPIIKYRIRIICSLLSLQATFALAILVKSCIWFIPWLIQHIQHRIHTDKQDKELWLSDLLFHTAVFALTCAPLMSLCGVAVAILYYARKVWKYGRFQKKMRRRPGGRGYWMDPKDNDEGQLARAAETGIEQHAEVVSPVKDLDTGLRKGSAGVKDITPFVGPARDNNPYVGGDKRGNEVLFDAEVQVREPQAAVFHRSDTASSYQSNPYTLGALTSVWGAKKDKLRSGYDGRDVRRKNFEDEMEMCDRLGKQ
jgi:hypothetical protein